MPRQLRIEYSGAIYHLMNRGDHREPIFQDDFDRKRFLATLGEAFREELLAQVRARADDGRVEKLKVQPELHDEFNLA